jgi:hypothetical protein
MMNTFRRCFYFQLAPLHYGELNCASFVAGVVKGVLTDAGFEAEVSAYYSAGAYTRPLLSSISAASDTKYT